MTTRRVTLGPRMASIGMWRAVLAGTLATAGVMHLLLTADHFGESTLMGLGFAGATVAELGLAAAVLVRPGRPVYAAVIAVAAALVALYVYNVLIGLPFVSRDSVAAPAETAVESAAGHGEATGHDEGGEVTTHGDGEGHAGHHTEGLVLGAGEPVDAAGAATKAAELVSIGIAAGLLMRERRRTP